MKTFQQFLSTNSVFIKSITLLLVLLIFNIPLALGKIIFVKSDAGGSSDGTSWENAYTDLQSALDIASSGNEIWVAVGTYYPSTLYDPSNGSPTDPRMATFKF